MTEPTPPQPVPCQPVSATPRTDAQLWITDYETGKDYLVKEGLLLDLHYEAWDMVKAGKDAWTRMIAPPTMPKPSLETALAQSRAALAQCEEKMAKAVGAWNEGNTHMDNDELAELAERLFAALAPSGSGKGSAGNG